MHLLFPLAFLSGVHGFIIFAPYLLTVMAVRHLHRAHVVSSQLKPRTIPVSPMPELAFARA
jgi:hypothetical protein